VVWKDQDKASLITSEEIQESMKAIDDFDHRLGKEPSVAFSKVHFAAPKQPVSTWQTA
jgi:hypothetical protein